jgi:hypothetical protein
MITAGGAGQTANVYSVCSNMNMRHGERKGEIMTNLQDQVWDALINLDSETLLQVITDYHGMQLFDEDFAEFLVDEGFLDPEVIGRDEDEEDEGE